MLFVFDSLANSMPATILFTALLGLMVGSFLNVLIYRLPIMMQRGWRAEALAFLEYPPEPNTTPFNLALPPSRCGSCNHRIRPWENVPVLSWLALRGKCASCKTYIPFRYPAIEIVAALISGFIGWHFGFTWTCAAALLLTWALIAITFIDIDHFLIPDSIVLPLIWLGLVLNLYEMFVTLEMSVTGAVIGYMSLWVIYWAFKLLTGKEGMGHGDFKLLAMLGAWGGWQILPWTIFFASIIAAVFAGLATFKRHESTGPTVLPFGPYLAIAGWVSLVFGDQITAWYLKAAGIA